MKQLHARYPFLESARNAVESADVDLLAVIEGERVVVDRAVDRLESALDEGTVGDAHRRTRIELLSYPVARVLVSLIDEHVLTRKYAQAEARTAHERFREDFSATGELKSGSREHLSLDTVLSEFDLTTAVQETTEGYNVEVGTYLHLAATRRGEQWRLVNRALADGLVPVTEAELLVLVQQATRQRVLDGLPLSVPDAFEDGLESECDHLRSLLADLDLTRDIDTVVPELFPPCMAALLDRVQKGDHLEHHSRFAIATFLTTIGLTTDEIVDLFDVNPGFGEEATRYQVDHIRGKTSPTEYTPPSCSTMQSYGDCVNKDDLCENIPHPLSYYEVKLEDADEAELVDWREQEENAES